MRPQQSLGSCGSYGNVMVGQQKTSARIVENTGLGHREGGQETERS